MTPLTWITPLAIGLAAAYAVSGAMLGRLDEASPRGEIAPTAVSTERPVQTSDVILQKNILGLRTPAPESVANASSASSRPQAGADPADWPLVGVIAGSRSGALVLADGEARLIPLHDVFKGWELTEAAGESVVWTSGPQRREIVLRKDKADQPAPGAATDSRPDEGRSEKFTLDKDEAAKLLVDPNAILQQARFSPNQSDGKVDGFRISSIRGDSIFARMGMQNGDVLMSVNGEQIDNPEKLLRVYSGLKAAQAVNLNLRRQGQVRSILVDLR